MYRTKDVYFAVLQLLSLISWKSMAWAFLKLWNMWRAYGHKHLLILVSLNNCRTMRNFCKVPDQCQYLLHLFTCIDKRLFDTNGRGGMVVRFWVVRINILKCHSTICPECFGNYLKLICIFMRKGFMSFQIADFLFPSHCVISKYSFSFVSIIL